MLFIQSHAGKAGAHFFDYLGLPGAQFKRTLTWDEAGSLMIEGRCLGVVDRWTVVTDPTMFIVVGDEIELPNRGLFPCVIESRLPGFTQKGPVVGVSLEANTGTYGISVWNRGQKRRLLIIQGGNVIRSEGDPLPEEIEALKSSEDLEQGMLRIVQALTVPFTKCAETPFSEYVFDDAFINFVHS
jgi:hypothetical protein